MGLYAVVIDERIAIVGNWVKHLYSSCISISRNNDESSSNVLLRYWYCGRNVPDIYRERLTYNELIIMLKGDATHAKEIKVRRWIDKEDGGGIHHKTIQYREREKKW